MRFMRKQKKRLQNKSQKRRKVAKANLFTIKKGLPALVVDKIIAAIKAGFSRKCLKLDRCLESIKYMHREDGIVILWFRDLGPSTRKRIIDKLLELEIIVLVKEYVFMSRRSEYKLTEKYLSRANPCTGDTPTLEVSHTLEKLEATTSSTSAATGAILAKSCELDCVDDCLECIDLDSDNEAFDNDFKLESLSCIAYSESISERSKKNADVKVVDRIVDVLARGSVTFKELMKFAPSKRTLQRALSYLRKAGYLMVTGLGRSKRFYSLVCP